MTNQQQQAHALANMLTKHISKIILGNASENSLPAMQVTSNASAVASNLLKQGENKFQISTSQEKQRPTSLVGIVPTSKVGTGNGTQGPALIFDIGLLNSPTALDDLIADANAAAKDKR